MNLCYFKKLGVFLVLFTPLFIVNAESEQSPSQANVTVFDGYCFQNYDSFNNIKYMVEAVGGKAIPEKIMNGDPVMRKLGGNGYTVTHEKKMYIIAYAENAGCSVMTKPFEPENIISLLKELYSIKLIQKDTNGIQITEMYEIRNDSVHNGDILSVIYPKETTGLVVGTLSFVPAHTIKKIIDKK
jgi:hypothetical protein